MSLAQFPLTVASLKSATPYAAYSYSYPHKTAYRPISPALSLHDAWKNEAVDSLFLYVHLPFCEMRCGFCNLFTTANPSEDVVDVYLQALQRHCRRISNAIASPRFARFAIGGGTPTFLLARQLQRLFDLLARDPAVDPRQTPTSVETSPRTADDDRLGVLKDRGVSRISIGVQSMIDSEVNAAGRAQKEQWVTAAIDRIRKHGFATLNVDLMYGLPGQSAASFAQSLKRVLKFRPEELYLYPLYVRPLTGLDRWGEQPADQLRLDCYRAGRDLLLAGGYEQLSMRMFRASWAPDQGGPVYCCQDDGMVGLGCGARSYTTGLHYSSEYAVGAAGVKAILRDYLTKTDADFDRISYGCFLDGTEQQRRYIIKSLLRSEGLSEAAYVRRFGRELLIDVPEITDLVQERLVERNGSLRLTESGMERSDAIGPYLYSGAVKQMMDDYELH